MGALVDILNKPESRLRLIQDCIALIENEVNRRSGITGLAIKGGTRLVKAMKPTMIRDMVDFMLDDFLKNLDPIVEACPPQEPMRRYLPTRRRDVANALLAITDGKARKSSNQGLKKIYEKLRPYGEKQVEESVPGIADLVERHLGKR